MKALITRAQLLSVTSPLGDLTGGVPLAVALTPATTTLTYTNPSIPLPNARELSAYFTYAVGAPAAGQLLITPLFEPTGFTTFYNDIRFDPALNIVAVEFDQNKFYLEQKLSPVVASGTTIQFVWTFALPVGCDRVRFVLQDQTSATSTVLVRVFTRT